MGIGGRGSMIVTQPFISRVTGKLDGKGRVCIPANYRQILAAQNTAGVYMCPSFHDSALECFGEEVLQKFHLAQAELDPFFARQHDDRARAVLTMTEQLPLDENGRVRLPDDMIAHAGLKENVVFVGLGTKFQIWNPETFRPVLSRTLENARTLRDGPMNGGAI
jgi:MraZ protein